jgi:3-methyladenine DNA glycosylase AlkD
MTVQQIMTELQSMGNDSIKALLMKHGIKEPLFGVKIEQLKTIEKKVKKDYQLAKDLYATGNADAMYLAGLIADDAQMTAADLQVWVRQALSQNISEYTVPWVAAGSPQGYQLALQWIDAQEEHIAAAGWATLRDIVTLRPDAALDISTLKALLARVVKTIATVDDRVRMMMNAFIISVGSYVPALSNQATAAATTIGTLIVDMHGRACKVPDAAAYIEKAKAKGTLGKKKKMVKC